MAEQLIRITCGAYDQTAQKQNLLQSLSQLFQRYNVGFTIQQSNISLDQQAHLHDDEFDGTATDNATMTLESVVTAPVAQQLQQPIHQLVGDHGQFTIVDSAATAPAYLLKIFTRRTRHFLGADNVDQLLRLLQQQQIKWATVSQASAGYGQDQVVWRPKVGHHNVPLIIEAIVPQNLRAKLQPQLKVLIKDGVFFWTPVLLG